MSPADPAQAAPVLLVEGAGFAYRTADGLLPPVLADLRHRVPAGQMHTVLGPVGAGTSTLCRLVTGLLHDRGETSGTIRVTAPRGDAGTAVMLGDDPEAQLTGMTTRVADELQLPARLHGVSAATARSRAEAAANDLGITDLWDRRVTELSGGQRQLVALAALLGLQPDLLVLDQPGLSLDPTMRGRLSAMLRDYCDAGGAVLVTGHQVDEFATAADQVLALGPSGLASLPLTADAVRAAGVWDARAASAPAPGPTPTAGRRGAPLLAVRGLHAARGDRPVLRGADLDVHAGEVVALMGPNGAGKSTLLRSLLGTLDRRDQVSGTITADGVDLARLPTHERSAHLGWVGQDPGAQLSAPTVRDELMRAAPLPRRPRHVRDEAIREREKQVQQLMRAAGLVEAADEHPFDLDAAQRKDVVIAAALLRRPPVLLLDEPTLGRDAASMSRLVGLIDMQLQRGGGVLATTHDQHWAQAVAHRQLHLDSGRIS
ncbi:ATP-binding cassette domain-containing protein [Helcobacillus massiliensis]|uniref:Energy-coupling factor transport system ATP-binding protein n=1 Tax=Helcobacillus massiliensis TaxID=521392 RepID=A0A839QZJ5_9MICO|nr:ABC transporter ATP-binding protein [Helcobacillus massiliensis]MBB3022817.1 energy-coupling factor transport system ATP-binding protein [Helcobacillus massiliensis]